MKLDEWKIRWNWLKGFVEEQIFTAGGFSDGREIFRNMMNVRDEMIKLEKTDINEWFKEESEKAKQEKKPKEVD